MSSDKTFYFEDVTLDVAAMRLSRGSHEQALEPKSFRVLVFLIDHRERVVTKQELFRVVWEETAVTDNALTRAVAQIRKVLGDDPKQPRFIETVPTVGYRFVGQIRTKPGLVETMARPTSPPAIEHRHLPPASPLSRRNRALLLALCLLLLAATGTGLLLTRGLPTPVHSVSAPVPLTSYRGEEDAPSLSPDGSQVAFQWNGERGENIDIYAKPTGADATPLRLTTDPAADRWPAWSPDGSTIAFQRFAGDSRVELRLIPALGGPERRLAEYVVDGVGSAPAWSPDNRWLVVCVWIKDRVELMRVSADTGQMSQLTAPDYNFDDDSPAISSDGRTLLFVRRPDFYYWGDLYRMPLKGDLEPDGAPQKVVTGHLTLSAVAWMPSGAGILVHSAEGVSRMESSGSEHPEPVPFLGADVGSLGVSRIGKRVAFATVRGDANIWRLDLSHPNAPPQELIASTFRDVSPRYSPDGKSIAFQSNRTQSNRSIGRSQIWIADAEGRHERQLTTTSAGTSASPHWSPDGSILAFDSNISGSWKTYTIGIDGGPVSQRMPGLVNLSWTWSPDGRWVYSVAKENGLMDIWRLSASGGAISKVTRNGGESPALSADGKTLYFIKMSPSDQHTGEIWKMPLPDGQETRVAASVYRSNYAVTRHGVYFMGAPGPTGTCVLKFLSSATGLTRTVASMGHPELGLDVSPDDHYLVYAQLDGAGRDLMMMNGLR